jgi:hypothetical protein
LVVRSLTIREAASTKTTKLVQARSGSAGAPTRSGRGKDARATHRIIGIEQSEGHEAQSELKSEDPALGEASLGLAQGGILNGSRPNEVSGRSVADDVEE